MADGFGRVGWQGRRKHLALREGFLQESGLVGSPGRPESVDVNNVPLNTMLLQFDCFLSSTKR
jgi:hypothetical protein